MPFVFKNKPKNLLDIGGNTGKWALQCVQFDADVRVTIADMPGQLRMAEKNVGSGPSTDRINYHALNSLNSSDKLPSGHDAVWMSQSLDCFSQEEIKSIFKRTAAVLGPGQDPRRHLAREGGERAGERVIPECVRVADLHAPTYH